MSVPSNKDFADEVRSDRLATLWKVTLAGAGVIFWGALSLLIVQRSSTLPWIGAAAALTIGCLLARFFLKRDRYTPAVWSYALGCVIATSLPMTSSEPIVVQVAPFVMPILIFLFGLLLSPISTLFLAVVAAVLILFMPMLGGAAFGITTYQIVAMLLCLLSILLSSQVSGEIYQVTEWALENYQRQRRTNHELFENRQELQRSLQRSEVLGDQLKETNVELEGARAAAEEAKHFRGQFLANMSHELRTPLNAIIGFSETMLNFPIMYDDVALPTPYEADLRQIFTSGKSLLNLINDILDLAKVDAGRLEVVMQPVEIEPIVRAVMSTAVGLLGTKQVELKRVMQPDLPRLWADESRVRQVLLNLYSNAAKFTDAGIIELTVRETDEGVMFSLRDSGTGIDARDLNLIFEEFKQASNTGTRGRDPRSGAGLGLAISLQLLNLMGGRIWAESEGPGRGSTFHFVVQRYSEPVKQPEPEA
jgi:signal transduction histidine kinase